MLFAVFIIFFNFRVEKVIEITFENIYRVEKVIEKIFVF